MGPLDTAGQTPQSIDDVLDEFEKGPVSVQPELPEVEVIAEGQEPPAAAEEKKEPEQPKEDPSLAKLRAEVEEIRRREAAERAERERMAKVAAAKALEAQRNALRAQTSEYDLVANALTSAQEKMAVLEQQFAAASEAMDWKQAAAIQKQMSILGARITQLEDGKAHMEQRAEQMRRQAEMQRRQALQQRQQAPQNVDPFEASIAHLSEPSKQWARQHREWASSPEKWDEVVAAHYIVTKKQKVQVDTPEYFEAIEKELGIRQADPEQPVTPPKKAPPAAPVSRGNGAANGSKTQVRLTAEEVRIAHDMGMTPEEYARGKVLREKQQQAQMRVH